MFEGESSLFVVVVSRITIELSRQVSCAMEKPRNPNSVVRRFIDDDEALHQDVVAERVARRVQLFVGPTDERRVRESVECRPKLIAESPRLLDAEALYGVRRNLSTIVPGRLGKYDPAHSALWRCAASRTSSSSFHS